MGPEGKIFLEHLFASSDGEFIVDPSFPNPLRGFLLRCFPAVNVIPPSAQPAGIHICRTWPTKPPQFFCQAIPLHSYRFQRWRIALVSNGHPQACAQIYS